VEDGMKILEGKIAPLHPHEAKNAKMTG